MSTFKLVTDPTPLNPVKHDLELDENHQIVWVGLDRNDDEDQVLMVAQMVTTRLLELKGEWYQDLREGTPWRQIMFMKGTSLTVKRQVIRQVIQDTPGVADVTSVSISEEAISRMGQIVFSAMTDRGFVITQQELDVPFIVDTTEGEVVNAN